MPLAPGTKLDGYEIRALLGAGGMGEVYRARDPALKREVAVKVLPSFVSRDPERLLRFEQEAQAAAALEHPNILAVHQFGVFQDAPYLVTELLVGESLWQALQRCPVPVRKAIDYAVQVARGLALRTTMALFTAISNRRICSSQKTGVSKFWTSDWPTDSPSDWLRRRGHDDPTPYRSRHGRRHRRLHVARAGARQDR